MGKVINLFNSQQQNKKPQPTDGNQLKAENFLNQIIRPSLKVTGLGGRSAETLLLGTALAESGLDTLQQFGGGPALSFFQIEPATYKWIVRYLSGRKDLRERILSACFIEVFPEPECLTWNIRLATLIARMVYWTKPEPLPHYADPVGMAEYWKEHYNTEKGRGTTEHFLREWRRYARE